MFFTYTPFLRLKALPTSLEKIPQAPFRVALAQLSRLVSLLADQLAFKEKLSRYFRRCLSELLLQSLGLIVSNTQSFETACKLRLWRRLRVTLLQSFSCQKTIQTVEDEFVPSLLVPQVSRVQDGRVAN